MTFEPRLRDKSNVVKCDECNHYFDIKAQSNIQAKPIVANGLDDIVIETVIHCPNCAHDFHICFDNIESAKLRNEMKDISDVVNSMMKKMSEVEKDKSVWNRGTPQYNKKLIELDSLRGELQDMLTKRKELSNRFEKINASLEKLYGQPSTTTAVN